MPNRRRFLALGAVAAVGALGAGWWATRLPQGPALSAPEAAARVAAGTLLLVDIRRPDEWAATGSAEGAARLDMREPGFIDALAAAAGGDRGRPIALICAAGVRSARMAARLRAAGFTQVFDVPEGMRGSAAGPGWLARGLPLNRG
jgi:rhodanese-related sulfurtransferase